MAEDRAITLAAWPDEPLRLAHGFEGDSPLPLQIDFVGETPLAVRLGSAGGAIPINMRMLLAAPKAIPLCLQLCEAICAESDYSIRVTLFDRPIITIRLRGQTRLFSEV